MARENRDVRPFDGLPEVQSWLEDKVTLRIYPNEGAGQIEPIVCVADSTMRVDPQTLATADIKLHIEKDELVLAQRSAADRFAKNFGNKTDEIFSIVLYGSSKFLRFKDELIRWNFSDLEKMRDGFSLLNPDSSRPRSLRLPHNGTVFDLAVVLNSAQKPKIGLPHRLGTWLAHIQFKLANPSEGIGFNPLPLTIEKRQELKVSQQTATYCQINPQKPDLLGADMLDDFLLFYVDSATLDRLSANPLHPQSALYQTQIFIDALKFLVTEFQRLENVADVKLNDIDDRLIGRLLRVVSTDEAQSLQAWLEILRDEPEVFIAEVESICNYQKRIDESLGLMIKANQ
jgi:hypothetical protein